MANEKEKKIIKLEYMAAKKIYYRVLNLCYIFNTGSFYCCSCHRFQCYCWPNGETKHCFICPFMQTHYPVEIKIKDV